MTLVPPVSTRVMNLATLLTQAARREALTTLSTSIEEKQQYAGQAKIAAAALESAQAQLRHPEDAVTALVVEQIAGLAAELLEPLPHAVHVRPGAPQRLERDGHRQQDRGPGGQPTHRGDDGPLVRGHPATPASTHGRRL